MARRLLRFMKIPACGLLMVLISANAPASEVRVDVTDPFVRVESNRLVGDKGELTFDVSVPVDQARCGQVWAFDHAELEIIANRFGDAQFVALPEPGCTDCSPGVVRWFHEPTGYLTFEVHVYRKQLHKPCTQRPLQPQEIEGAHRAQDN